MNTPPDRYELYAEFGIASEKAQVLEVAAGNLALGYLTLFIKPDDVTSEITALFKGIINDINKKTLGQLLKKIRTQMNVDEFIETTLTKALDKRNYLSHHFFRTHNFAIDSEIGRAEMILELKEIQSILDKAHNMLDAMSSNLEKIAGRSPEQTLEITKSLQAKGRRVKI